MNVSQLKYIVSVDSERNFARAAKLCHVAQPTLSKEIQKLEHKLDVMIFDRTRTPVVPTRKGVKLIEQARCILKEVSRFQILAESEQNDLSGECILGICPSIAPYLLPLFLPDFGNTHPKLNIHIREMPVDAITQALLNEDIDAAICCLPEKENAFYQFKVGDEPYVAYVSEDNPLFGEASVDMNIAIKHGLHLASDVIEQIGSQLGSCNPLMNMDTANLIMESGSLETMRRFVELGKGITLIPRLASLYMGQRRRRYVRDVLQPLPKRKIVLATRRGFQKRDVLSSLNKSVRQAFELGMKQTDQLDLFPKRVVNS
ncbi:LysR family transcriptional regulator [Vibrio sp. SCSIO 43132]|uniref:LysR substrate-binding domain-containing protein n=1 Tax=Vibrio sp. SCSIO 43132 TaxID=2779363 RepID=UPI001CA975CE|nr:LysR substrate-binding domain-containing protein [Vibrio sp. SCSIO 43132]UAB73700.1 LysR family transcriptional regulator [Vibrio sp. SCSIO 43132]